MKWNIPVVWVAVGVVGGAGLYAAIDKGGVLAFRLNETECQRFDRRCATFNAAGTHWVGSALCNLSGIMIQERTEEKCSKLNAKLDEVIGQGEAKEKSPTKDPGIHLKNWSAVWKTDSHNAVLRMNGEMENPLEGTESFEKIRCEAVVALHYQGDREILTEDSSFLCSGVSRLSLGQSDRLRDRQVVYFPANVTDYPLDRVTMSLTFSLTNPFGEEFERSFGDIEIPGPDSDQPFALPVK